MILVRENDKMKNPYWYLSFIMIIPIFIFSLFISLNYGIIYGTNPFSVQFLVIIISNILITIFLFLRIFNKPKIEGLTTSNAKFYLSIIIQIIEAVFAGFIIALSILWGSIYPNVEGLEVINNLKFQGVILLGFIIIAGFSTLCSLIYPLIKQIK